jgi:beta-mannosidase
MVCAIWAAGSLAQAARPPRDPAAYYPWPRAEQLSLDGTWDLAWTDPPQEVALPANLDRLEWFPATVPGEVHWALHRAGKAPHPYVGLNAKSLRWVEDKSWWYRKRFTAPAAMARCRNVNLVMEGVDYYAHYWLNGRYLGRSEGALGAVVLPAKGLRADGENELVIRVDCGGYKLGKQGGAPAASLVKSELWSGWRLGAADLITVGIWQPVRLVACPRPCLDRPFVQTLSADDQRAQLRTVVEISADEAEQRDTAVYQVQVTLRGRGFAVTPIRATATVDLSRRPGTWSTGPGYFLWKPKEGTTRHDAPHRTVLVPLELTVPQPRRWWPNQLGEQPQYEAEFVLSKDGRRLDRIVTPFGIRTIVLEQGPQPAQSYESRGWLFRVNGRPMFVKGTNWMPIDALADATPEHYEWSLSLARDAGIQMIRIWGGGTLEPEAFYELCDRYGIMVWQDFPLTCAWRAEKINRQVWRDTVMWTIFRLRNHPSLAFWCGGNEFAADDPTNADLVFMLYRYVSLLDGSRPVMGASPDDGDLHDYPQWDATWAYQSPLVDGPFVSEWGSHGMPSVQTYRETVNPREATGLIGPTLLKMNKRLMEEQYPEITNHWVEFEPGRLPQMLSRGSAFDELKAVNLERFSDAVNCGAAEYDKYSAEAARGAYPRCSGLLFWVWKRPWPTVGIQICDGLGQPLPEYYDIKRAFSQAWPCLVPPHLNYAPGEAVSMRSLVLGDFCGQPRHACRLSARLVGPDLAVRQRWNELATVDVSGRPEPVAGPTLNFQVPQDFARRFFFVIAELADAQGRPVARNVYPLRCPPQFEDAAFRAKYRVGPRPGLTLDQGPWLRPQVSQHPTTLACKVLAATRDSDCRGRLRAEIRNTGSRPAVMAALHVGGRLRYVADDAYFWLEPGESRVLNLRLRLEPDDKTSEWRVAARAWNVAQEAAVTVRPQTDSSNKHTP